MQLDDIRKTINQIDAGMKDMFDKRLEQSGYVVSAKLKTNDEVFKPVREKEILDRYVSADERWYRAFMKKLIEISRKYQYSLIIDSQLEDDKFFKSLSNENQQTLMHGGELCLSFHTDSDGTNGLSIQGVLSVLSSTELLVKRICADSDSQSVELVLQVDDTEQARKEAYTFVYMLYKEAIW